MGSVVAFPTKEITENALRDTLSVCAEELDELYAELDELHSKLHDLELRCNRVELAYDEKLTKYAKRVGAENVEVEFIAYTSRHIVAVDPEAGSMQLILVEEEQDED